MPSDETICDQRAYVCRDCLMLIANGEGPNYEYDYPGKSEEEYPAMRAKYDADVARETEGYSISLGWLNGRGEK